MTAEPEYTLQDLEKYLSVELERLEQESNPYRITHTVQVTSFGGSGTTAVCRHLLDANVDLQPGPGQWPFKHRRWPPQAAEVPAGFRVLYIVGDPRDAILSIFGRNLQFGHYGSLHGKEPDATAHTRLQSIETFLDAGVDDFELDDHVDRWLRHPAGYPVMVVRYDRIHDTWPDVHEFVGLSRDYAALPRRERRNDWRTIPLQMQKQLDDLYGPLARRIQALPAVQIV